MHLYDVRVPHAPLKQDLLDRLIAAYRAYELVPPPIVLVNETAIAITGSHRIAAMKRASLGALRLSSPTLARHLLLVDCSSGVLAQLHALAGMTLSDALGDFNRLCATADAYLDDTARKALADQYAAGYQPPVRLEDPSWRKRRMAALC